MIRIWLVVLIIGALILTACGAEPTPAPKVVPLTLAPTEPLPTQVPTEPPPTVVPTGTTFDSPLDMVNPASKFCADEGYQEETRSEAGGEVGYCLFPDGSECEEWAFYRGECKPGTEFKSPIGMPNPASVFCAEEGNKLEMRQEAGGTVGYCLFPDGSECEEWAFFRSECKPASSP